MQKCFLALTLAALVSGVQAFTVVKNVNSGKPPVEKVVLFDKNAPDLSKFKFDDPEKTAKITVAPDKSLQIHFPERKSSSPTFYLPGGEANVKNYNYVLFTFRVDGDLYRNWRGKWNKSPWDKLWMSAYFVDAQGKRSSAANLDAVSPDGKMPREKTATVCIPVILMNKPAYGVDAAAKAVGFQIKMGKGGEAIKRDFTMTVDKISLAD